MADLLSRRNLLNMILVVKKTVFYPFFSPLLTYCLLIAVLQRLDSFNNTAIGVGTGIAVVILIIGVTILNLYLYRKRQMSKTTGTHSLANTLMNYLLILICIVNLIIYSNCLMRLTFSRVIII